MLIKVDNKWQYRESNGLFLMHPDNPSLFSTFFDNNVKCNFKYEMRQSPVLFNTDPRKIGIEIETKQNFLPREFLTDFGLSTLRDGSIPGLEFASIPLSIQQCLTMIDLIKKECGGDHNCSIHLNFGVPKISETFNRKKFIKVIYAIKQIQKLNLFDDSLLYTGTWKDSGKDYNKPIPEYSKISDYLRFYNVQDFKFDKLNREYKWNRPWRYCWMNLDNYVHGQNRIELRVIPFCVSQKDLENLMLFFSTLLYELFYVTHTKTEIVELIKTLVDKYTWDKKLNLNV